MATITTGNPIATANVATTKINSKLSGAVVVKEVVAEPVGKTMHHRATDALEEAGMHYHQFRNNNRHRVRDDRRHVDRLSTSKLKEAAFAVDRLQELEKCSEHLRHSVLDEQFLPQWLASFSNDKGEQFVALTALKESLGPSSENHPARAQINQLLSPLQDAHQVNAALGGYATLAWATDNGIAKDTLERSTTPDNRSDNIQQTWKNLVRRFGGNALVAGPTHIYQQLSAKYHQGGSEIDVTELRAIIGEMSVLKSLLGLFDQCCEVVGVCMPTLGTDTTPTQQALSLFTQVLSLQQKAYVQMKDISGIARALNINTPSGGNALGVSLKRLINMLTPQWFDDPNRQSQCVAVISQFLDNQAHLEQQYG